MGVGMWTSVGCCCGWVSRRVWGWGGKGAGVDWGVVWWGWGGAIGVFMHLGPKVRPLTRTHIVILLPKVNELLQRQGGPLFLQTNIGGIHTPQHGNSVKEGKQAVH